MFKKILKSYDYSIVIVLALLIIFGLIMVYSASMVSSVQRYGFESDYFYQKQKINILLSTVFFIVVALVPYKILQSNKILIPMVGHISIRFGWIIRFWTCSRKCAKLV